MGRIGLGLLVSHAASMVEVLGDTRLLLADKNVAFVGATAGDEMAQERQSNVQSNVLLYC